MKNWSELKEFEVVYEEFDYFFTKQIVRRYFYLKAFDVAEAKNLAAYALGNVDIISVEEYV